MATDPPKILACWCSGTEDALLATIEPHGATLGSLRNHHADFLALQLDRPHLRWMEHSNLRSIRFFSRIWNDDEDGVDALFAVAEEAGGEYGDANDDWFELPAGTVLPERGDYRTAWEYLRVSESMIVAQGQGKHSTETFETSDILPLLKGADS